MPPLCNSPTERRNQSKIRYTLCVSPVPSSTTIAGTASPLDRRITTGPGKLIPALFCPSVSNYGYSPSVSRPHSPFQSAYPLLCSSACMHGHSLWTGREYHADAGSDGVLTRSSRLASRRMSSVVMQRTHRPRQVLAHVVDRSNRIQPRRRTDGDDRMARPAAAARPVRY